MKATFVLLATLASGAAFGACKDAALPEIPAIPNGAEASFEEMLEAQESVASYVDGAEAYLDCVKPEPFMHNYLVERIERTAERFNTERSTFLQRREAVAAK
jgi:hypothetical protein